MDIARTSSKEDESDEFIRALVMVRAEQLPAQGIKNNKSNLDFRKFEKKRK